MTKLALNSIIIKYRNWLSILLLSIFSIMMYPPNWCITASDMQQTIQIAEEEESQLVELSSARLFYFQINCIDLNIMLFSAIILNFIDHAECEIIPNPLEIILPPPLKLSR